MSEQGVIKTLDDDDGESGCRCGVAGWSDELTDVLFVVPAKTFAVRFVVPVVADVLFVVADVLFVVPAKTLVDVLFVVTVVVVDWLDADADANAVVSTRYGVSSSSS